MTWWLFWVAGALSLLDYEIVQGRTSWETEFFSTFSSKSSKAKEQNSRKSHRNRSFPILICERVRLNHWSLLCNVILHAIVSWCIRIIICVFSSITILTRSANKCLFNRETWVLWAIISRTNVRHLFNSFIKPQCELIYLHCVCH